MERFFSQNQSSWRQHIYKQSLRLLDFSTMRISSKDVMSIKRFMNRTFRRKYSYNKILRLSSHWSSKNVFKQNILLKVVWNSFLYDIPTGYVVRAVYCTLLKHQTKTPSRCFQHVQTKLFCLKSFVWSCVPEHQAKMHNQQVKCFVWQHFVWSVWTTWQPYQTWFNKFQHVGSSNTDFWCTYRKHSICIEWSYHVLYDTKNVLFEDVLLDSCAMNTAKYLTNKQNILNDYSFISHWCTKRYLHKSKRLVWRRFAWSVCTQPNRMKFFITVL